MAAEPNPSNNTATDDPIRRRKGEDRRKGPRREREQFQDKLNRNVGVILSILTFMLCLTFLAVVYDIEMAHASNATMLMTLSEATQLRLVAITSAATIVLGFLFLTLALEIGDPFGWKKNGEVGQELREKSMRLMLVIWAVLLPAWNWFENLVLLNDTVEPATGPRTAPVQDQVAQILQKVTEYDPIAPNQLLARIVWIVVLVMLVAIYFGRAADARSQARVVEPVE